MCSAAITNVEWTYSPKSGVGGSRLNMDDNLIYTCTKAHGFMLFAKSKNLNDSQRIYISIVLIQRLLTYKMY